MYGRLSEHPSVKDIFKKVPAISSIFNRAITFNMKSQLFIEISKIEPFDCLFVHRLTGMTCDAHGQLSLYSTERHATISASAFCYQEILPATNPATNAGPNPGGHDKGAVIRVEEGNIFKVNHNLHGGILV